MAYPATQEGPIQGSCSVASSSQQSSQKNSGIIYEEAESSVARLAGEEYQDQDQAISSDEGPTIVITKVFSRGQEVTGAGISSVSAVAQGCMVTTAKASPDPEWELKEDSDSDLEVCFEKLLPAAPGKNSLIPSTTTAAQASTSTPAILQQFKKAEKFEEKAKSLENGCKKWKGEVKKKNQVVIEPEPELIILDDSDDNDNEDNNDNMAVANSLEKTEEQTDISKAAQAEADIAVDINAIPITDDQCKFLKERKVKGN